MGGESPSHARVPPPPMPGPVLTDLGGETRGTPKTRKNPVFGHFGGPRGVPGGPPAGGAKIPEKCTFSGGRQNRVFRGSGGFATGGWFHARLDAVLGGFWGSWGGSILAEFCPFLSRMGELLNTLRNVHPPGPGAPPAPPGGPPRGAPQGPESGLRGRGLQSPKWPESGVSGSGASTPLSVVDGVSPPRM